MSGRRATLIVALALAATGYFTLFVVASSYCEASVGLFAVLAAVSSLFLGVAVGTRQEDPVLAVGGAVIVAFVATPVAILIAAIVGIQHC